MDREEGLDWCTLARVFVGRAQELEQVFELLERVRAGGGGFALLTGEAGIGKTRLAEELTRAAEARGFACAWGRAWEGGTTPAFWLWAQLLRQLKRTFGDSKALSHPELSAVLDPRGTPLASTDAEQARFTLFEHVARVLQELSDTQPLLLVLDDVQAADSATLALLQFVARTLSSSRLLLLATARDSSPTELEASRLLAQVAREARHFPLGRLHKEDVASWLDDDGLKLETDRVWQASEGNPLFVQELLAMAKKYPGATWRTAQLPQGIRGAIQARLGLLSPAARRLLETASILGREPTLELLRAIGSSELGALEEALASGIIQDMGDDRLRFSHILLRDELYSSIEPERRVALHRAAAGVARDRTLVAHHALEGTREQDTDQTFERVLAAMREASGRLAHEDAARLGQRALEKLEPSLPKRRVSELQVEIAEALVLAGDILGGQRAAERAAALAAAQMQPDLLARSALTRATEIPFTGDAVASDWLRRALAALPVGDSPMRVDLMARLAVALNNTPGAFTEQTRLIKEAVAIARRVGDENALLSALHNAAGTFPTQLTARERFALYAETVKLAETTGTIGKIAPLLSWHVVSWLELFEPEQAMLAVDRCERLLAPYTRPHYRWRVPLMRALLLATAGRFQEAERMAQESIAISRAHGVQEGMAMYAIYASSVAYLRGDDVGLQAIYSDIEDSLRALPLFEIFASIWEAPLGRTEAVRRAFERFEQIDAKMVPGAPMLGWPCARAGLTDYAESFFQLSLTIPKTIELAFAPGGFGLMGPICWMQGQLAQLSGRSELALQHFAKAAQLASSLKSPPLVAQIELSWAEALAAHDPQAAAEHAQLALRAAQSVGLEVTAKRAARLLEVHTAKEVPSAGAVRQVSLLREGDVWLLQTDHIKLRLSHSKGLAYLETLLLAPYRPVHALELAGVDEQSDGGPMLDEQARRAYRARAATLQQELEEATAFNDLGRSERLQRELDAIGDELSRAFGISGKARSQSSTAERARINVQRRLRDVIKRVTEQDKVLGRHLELSVKTGNYCMYAPTWPA
jgi:tetratricopeptide (TPR) repeat protein